MLGRPHDFEAVDLALETVGRSQIGFSNVSLDLMIGIPLQTLESFQRNLRKLISFDVGHCSLYMLQVEPGTPFYKMYDKNRDLLPSDELVSEMYECCQEFLGEHGLHQYEVSNFARSEGVQSKHNLMYWEGDREYLAFGMGAASFFNGFRFSRPKTLKKYQTWVDELEAGEWDFLFEEGANAGIKLDCEDLSIETPQKLLETLVMCQLRKTKGLEIKKLQNYMNK